MPALSTIASASLLEAGTDSSIDRMEEVMTFSTDQRFDMPSPHGLTTYCTVTNDPLTELGLRSWLARIASHFEGVKTQLEVAFCPVLISMTA